MRRILVTVGGTLAGVAAVFAYPTSTGGTVILAGAADASSTEQTTTPSAAGSGEGGSSDETSSGTSSSDGTSSGTSSSDDTSSGTSSSDDTSSGTSSSGTADSGTAASTMADGSYSASTSMQYGEVTVTITVSGGQITSSSGTQSSNDPKSQQISARALPTLDSEAVSAQRASISLVSHATYTSQAYEQSLQQAIDQAFAA